MSILLNSIGLLGLCLLCDYRNCGSRTQANHYFPDFSRFSRCVATLNTGAISGLLGLSRVIGRVGYRLTAIHMIHMVTVACLEGCEYSVECQKLSLLLDA